MTIEKLNAIQKAAGWEKENISIQEIHRLMEWRREVAKGVLSRSNVAIGVYDMVDGLLKKYLGIL